MKLISKKGLIAAALATAFVGISATAIAQGMGGMSHGMHAQHMAQGSTAAGQPDMAQRQAQRMESMQKYHAERQAQLKTELKLTADQEPAWNAFVARTAHEPRAMKAGAREDWSKLTTPERLDKMQALKAERDAQMTQRIDATKSFYAALTPEQQKVFDTQAHGGMQRAGMKGEHRMGGKGGHKGMGSMGGMGCEAGMQKQS
ncbi:MAG: Spy/CpxP family protein refolding chaperone [Hydrogenophaga sp.]|uniref:Spy/CpxP family protein refolding chaperone n=1 Tax=Hydrogenophaga sp. TaxID=1904254 RepID=UPI002778366A|nr:Spy/CpxP family protein refolding chaperone [Hydrogenophaga sp.]MDP2417011.1 Spy/CpxP family protein refolding chaperone [Hydrogenophaga sp.]MDZ4190277.1 Spy/CpxP family protein refolding chaperone [Hydrogenophaga sp.]